MFTFGTFELDPETDELRKSGVRTKLSGQPIQVLRLLVERAGKLVTREELKDALWEKETFTDFDHGLNTAIQRIRGALGDSATNPRFIETLPRRGYRFVAPVDDLGTERSRGSWPIFSATRLDRTSLVLVLAGILALGFAFSGGSGPSPDEVPFRRFNFALPVEVGSGSLNVTAAISPDGRYIAYVERGAQGRLWIQDLDCEDPRVIEGSQGADGPFWRLIADGSVSTPRAASARRR